MIKSYSLKRRIIYFFIYYSGLNWIYFRFLRKPGKVTFIAHRVLYPDTIENKIMIYSGAAISVEQFVKRVKFIKKNFNIENQELSPVFTFDDGYKDNLQIALPILKRFNVKPFFFIVNDFLFGRSVFWVDKVLTFCAKRIEDLTVNNKRLRFNTLKNKSLSFSFLSGYLKKLPENKINEFVAEMSVSNFPNIPEKLYITQKEVEEIKEDVFWGTHTKSHKNLTFLNEKQLDEEIFFSKKELEEKLNLKVKFFAYPYGFYNTNVINYLKKKEIFDKIYATGNVKTDNKFCTKRLNFNLQPFYVFAVESSGIFNWLKKIIKIK